MLAAALLITLATVAPMPPKSKPAPAAPATVVPAAPQVTESPATGHVREVMLDPKKRLVAEEIHPAPAFTTTLTFPEPWVSAPACGDCQYGDAANKGQFWRLDVDPVTNSISVKFLVVPTSAMLADPPNTNINLQLEGGLYISIVVVLTLDAHTSDLRVDFRLPRGDGAKEKLTAKEKELNASFDARVADAASKELLAALLPGTRCVDFAGSPRRSDSMVVRLNQLCRNGRYAYVTFDVQNRQRGDLQLATATLTNQSGATNVETRSGAEVPVVLFDQPVLVFNAHSRGIAAIPLTEPNPPPTTYTLVVTEEGGKERSVTIEGIEPRAAGCTAVPVDCTALGALALGALVRRRRLV